jgi:hypothetical protein
MLKMLQFWCSFTLLLGRKHFFDLSRKRKLLRKVPQFSRNFVNFSRKFFTKTFRKNLNLTKSGIKYQERKNIWSRIRGFFGPLAPDPDPSDSDPVRILVLFEENRSGSWSYLRIRVSAKIPWIRNTDMEIFFRLMNVKRCFRR